MRLKVGDWQVEDFPESLPPEVYEQAAAEFVRYFSSIEGVCSIYRYGSVSYPGLSDLDFMVVLDDNYSHRPGVEYNSPPLSPQASRAIRHQQFFMPRSLFSLYPLMMPIFEIEHVWGERQERGQFPAEALRLADTLFVCEDIATKFPEFILQSLSARSVSALHAQAQLNLITKFSRLVERTVGCGVPGADTIEKQITDLRMNWHSRPAEESARLTANAIRDAEEVVAGMARVTNDYIMRSGLFPGLSRSRQEWPFRYPSLRVVFGGLHSDLTLKAPGKWRPPEVLAPLGLMLPLVWLCSGTGPLSQYIRNLFEVEPPRCDFSRPETLRRIVDAQNAHCSFLIASGVVVHIFGYYSYHSDYSPGVRTLSRLALRALRSRSIPRPM